MKIPETMIQQVGEMPWEDFQSLWQSDELKTEEDRIELLVLRCATDKKLYAEVFFPHYCTRPFNPLHLDMFADYKYGERDIKDAWAAPRGSAKSTNATLIDPIHDVCYGLEKFILVISSTTPLANAKLKDIRNEIQSNVRLRAVFGVRFPGKKAGESKFTVISKSGRCYFQALGRGSEVRGIRINENRPTKIVLDDVEFSEEVYNEKTREKTASWYLEDVVKSGDTGTNIVFVGTVLHKDALLPKLLANPGYHGRTYRSIISWSQREDLWNEWRRIYQNVDDESRKHHAQEYFEKNREEMLRGTEVLWPEKEDYLAHMKDIAENGIISFMKEKQNDPQGQENKVFAKVHWYREISEGYQILESGIIIKREDIVERGGSIDPSTGKGSAKSMGDYTSLLTGFKERKGRILVHQDWTNRKPPTQCIEEIFNHHEKWKYDRFSVETNLYRNLMMDNIKAEKERREKEYGKRIDIAFYECEQTENKIERITRLEPKVSHGHILFNVALSRVFKLQLEDFPNATNDDCPDALEQLYSLFNNRYKAAAMSVNVMAGR